MAISVQATGDGVTDDTAAVQAVLDACDMSGEEVYFPPGVYKVHTLNYRNQSLSGDGPRAAWIQGFPGEDILCGDTSLGQQGRTHNRIRGLRFVVDDSLDASASFPERGGVGNAAIAYDQPDGAAQTLRPFFARWEDLEITSLSGDIGGHNRSCGVYAQSLVCNSQLDNIHISRLAYGWWDHWPTSNLAIANHAGDNNEITSIYFDGCHDSVRLVNWGYAHIGQMGIQTAGVTDATGLTIATAASAGGERCTMTIGYLWLEMIGASAGTPLDIAGLTYGTIGTLTVQGGYPLIDIGGTQIDIQNGHLTTATNVAPVVRLSGDHLRVRAKLSMAQTDAAHMYELVDDRGTGNSFDIIGTVHSRAEVRTPRIAFPSGPTITTGSGAPEGVVYAPRGSVYLRTDGSATATLYVKTKGGGGRTGWTAK